ncbi:hypothetical protein TWF788_010360 [Orbilia oligospora]|uniref:F-box domain-containing protein n=1 Tax=Orbilia oligospora TaxID=2813651 RepID=A0A7C8KP20_ORBOL|nr:hypothetical protein TWF788_010360 [Orbilia oligospora]
MTTKTLESLPIDIKYSILTQLDDFRSLYSLCEASPVYASIYRRHQNLIDETICFQDIQNYRREALWLAVYRDRLYKFQPSRLEVLQSVAEYISYPSPPTNSTLDEEVKHGAAWGLLRKENIDPVAFATARTDVRLKWRNYSQYPIGKKEIDSLAKTHMFVLEVYQRFIKAELLKKYRISGSPSGLEEKAKIEKISGRERFCLATVVEERRIVMAIYRLLFLVNLYFHYHRGFVNMRRDWGFWENIHIRTVRDFLVDETEKVAKENIRGEEPSAYRAITGLLLLHEMPDYRNIREDGSQLWSPAQLKRYMPFMHIQTDPSILRISKEQNIPFWGHDDHNYDLYFLDLTNFDGEKVDAEHPSIFRLPLHFPTGEGFLRRGANFGFCVYVIFGNDGMLDDSFAIDLTASVWDTWRLIQWGYRYCDWEIWRYPESYWDYQSLSYGLDGKCKIIVDRREELEEYDSGGWFDDGDEAEIPERFGIKRENNCKGKVKISKGAKLAKGMRFKITGKTACKKRFDGDHDELGDILDRKLDLDL